MSHQYICFQQAQREANYQLMSIFETAQLQKQISVSFCAGRQGTVQDECLGKKLPSFI